MSLDEKLTHTRRLIDQWWEHWYGDVSVSFSGGLDSTVLLHIARETLGLDLPAYFVDTGLEYPSVKRFAKSQPGVDVIRPKLSFRQVLQKHGYPIISKKTSQYIKEARSAKKKRIASGPTSSSSSSRVTNSPARLDMRTPCPPRLMLTIW